MKFRNFYKISVSLALVVPTLVLLKSGSSYAVEDKQVILYTYLFDPQGENPGEPDVLFADFKKQMERIFPSRPILKVVATDREILQSQLDSILDKDEVISHLVIRGHGYSFDKFDYQDKGKWISFGIQIGESGMIEFGSPVDQEFEKLLPVIRTVNSASIDLFRGIRERWSEGAQVLITSCDLLAGTQDEARKKAQAIAYVLGLKNGNLYANRNQGVSIRNWFFNPKVQLIAWGFATGIWTLGCPVPVSAFIGAIPLAVLYGRSSYLDRLYNQGYRCSFSNGSMEISDSTKDEYEKHHFRAKSITLRSLEWEQDFK